MYIVNKKKQAFLGSLPNPILPWSVKAKKDGSETALFDSHYFPLNRALQRKPLIV